MFDMINWSDVSGLTSDESDDDSDIFLNREASELLHPVGSPPDSDVDSLSSYEEPGSRLGIKDVDEQTQNYIITLSHQKVPTKKIADAFQITDRTVRKYKQQYRELGCRLWSTRRGQPPKFNDATLQPQIEKIIFKLTKLQREQKIQMKRDHIIEHLKNDFGVKISKRHLQTKMKEYGFKVHFLIFHFQLVIFIFFKLKQPQNADWGPLFTILSFTLKHNVNCSVFERLQKERSPGFTSIFGRLLLYN